MQVKDMDMDDLNDGSDLDFSGSDLHPASDIFSVTPLEGHATFFPEIAFLTMLGGPWHQRLPMTEGFRACYAIWLGGLFVTSLSAVRFCDVRLYDRRLEPHFVVQLRCAVETICFSLDQLMILSRNSFAEISQLHSCILPLVAALKCG